MTPENAGAEHAAPSPPAPPAAVADAAGPTSTREVLRRLGPVGPLAIVAATLPGLAGLALLGALNPTGAWLREQGFTGLVLYVAAFAVASGLALLPTYAQAALGGWAFRFAGGFPAALLGFMGGATIGYFIARAASRDRVVRLIDEHPKWRAVYHALLGRGFWRTLGIVALLRLPPNSPFAVTNLLMAATRVSPAAYLLGTLLGMAPRTAAVVYAAASLNTLDAPRPRWLLVSGVATTIVVLGVLGLVANRAIERLGSAGGGAAPAAAPLPDADAPPAAGHRP